MKENIADADKKNPKPPRIETIKMFNGDSVSYCPDRGIITSLIIKGKEVLYMDENTLNNPETNVKGGVPILFPNAGPIPEELKNGELAQLEQHGFARKQKWDSTEIMEGINATLRDNEETRKVFPYSFYLSLISKFEKDGSFTVTEQVENLEAHSDMPVSFGLHPYFNVSNEQKKNIKFNFNGGQFVEENAEKWMSGKAISIENPGGPMEVIVPGQGTFVFKVSPEYRRIWFWSLPGKDFVCIEPVMRDKGGIITDPELIKPHQKYSASMNISFEEEK